jgi:hypothetical protein
VLDEVGFAQVRWGQQTDVFSGSQHESDARDFDTRGVTFAGVKAATARGRRRIASTDNATTAAGAGCEIYIKPDADRDPATDDDRPTLFGVPFVGPIPAHHDLHYHLHAWIWSENPDGMFADCH